MVWHGSILQPLYQGYEDCVDIASFARTTSFRIRASFAGTDEYSFERPKKKDSTGTSTSTSSLSRERTAKRSYQVQIQVFEHVSNKQRIY